MQGHLFPKQGMKLLNFALNGVMKCLLMFLPSGNLFNNIFGVKAYILFVWLGSCYSLSFVICMNVFYIKFIFFTFLFYEITWIYAGLQIRHKYTHSMPIWGLLELVSVICFQFKKKKITCNPHYLYLSSDKQFLCLILYLTASMVLGIDEEKGPQLFKCDPAGHFFGHKVIQISNNIFCLVWRGKWVSSH